VGAFSLFVSGRECCECRLVRSAYDPDMIACVESVV
jgi:hypothetical protein